VAVDPEDSEQGRHKPKKSRQERERNVGLELATLVSVDGVDIVPVEDVATGVTEHLNKIKSASVLLKREEYMRSLTLTKRPKAAHQQRLIIMSTGQCTKDQEKGTSHINAKNMDNAAITSV
jgi:hypothetical protein